MLTIQLPDDLENSLRAEVQSGHFASMDDAVAQAVRTMLVERCKQTQTGPNAPMKHQSRFGCAFSTI